VPDDAKATPLGGPLRALVLVLFFASGFAALVYQVVWSRLLGHVLGSTVYAVSAVLAAFMGGMALGAALFGRWIDTRRDAIRVYALLELGVVVCALAVPHVLRFLLTPLYGGLFRSLGPGHAALLPIRFAASVLVLLVPTALMGATLPVMTRFLTAPGGARVGVTVGALYAVNTLGAVVGSFTGGFVLLPAFGLHRTTLIAAGATFVAALGALGVWRHVRRREEALPMPEPERAAAPSVAAEPSSQLTAAQQDVILILFAISGLAALAYEVVWTRLLVFFIPNSVYAFAMMLTVYLLGIALGSALHNVFIRGTRHGVTWFIWLEALLGIAVALGLIVLPVMRGIVVRFSTGPFVNGAVEAFLRAAALMLLPTLLLGMIFPVATTLVANRPGKTGSGVGRAYFANTIGALLGAVLAAFVLVPLLGLRGSALALAATNGAIALAAFVMCVTAPHMLPQSARRAPRVAIAILVALAFTLAIALHGPEERFRTIFLADPAAELAYLDEGVGGTVTIEKYPTYRTISIDGVNVAGTNLAFETTQKLQAHLALLLHPDPKSVLQIGFGSGGTAYSASLHPLERLDCVELVPAIIDAAPEFDETNHGVLADPRVHVYIEDARAYVRHTRRTYDVILSDSTHPVFAGNGALYTVEYFQDCARRLKPGGVFSTWLPVHDLRFDDYVTILRSLRAAFPYIYVWHTSVGRNQWTIVNAFTRPLHAPYSSLEERMAEPKLATDLAQIYFTSPVDLMGLYLLGPHEVNGLATRMRQVMRETRGPYVTASWPRASRRVWHQFNTDDNLYIEFVAARAANNTSRERLFAQAFPKLLSLRPAGAVFLDLRDLGDERGGEVVQHLGRRWWSSNRILRGRLYELAGQVHRARAEWRRALRDDPADEVARDLLGITERALEDAKGLTPPATSYVEIGLYHLGRDEYDLAAAAFETALEHDPTYTAAHDFLARTRFKQDRLDDALAVTVHMRRHRPTPSTFEYVYLIRELVYAHWRAQTLQNDSLAWLTLADSALFVQEDDAAAEAAEAAVETAPAKAHALLAEIEITRGNFMAAAEHVRHLLEADPQYSHARLMLDELPMWREFPVREMALDLVGDAEGRSRAIRVLSMLKPEPPRPRGRLEKAAYHYARGFAFWEQLNFAGARREFELSIRLEGTFIPRYIALAQLAIAADTYDAGLDALAALETAAPGAGKGWGDAIKARRLLTARKALEQAGGNPTARQLYDVGMAYVGSLLYEEALEYLLKAERMEPNDTITLLNIAGCYNITWRLDKAIEYYEKVLAIDPENADAKRLLEQTREKMKPPNSGDTIPHSPARPH